MKTINGVLIFWSEIKIGSGGCELFVVGLGFGVWGWGGQEMDTRLTLPLTKLMEGRSDSLSLISAKLRF